MERAVSSVSLDTVSKILPNPDLYYAPEYDLVHHQPTKGRTKPRETSSTMCSSALATISMVVLMVAVLIEVRALLLIN